MSQRQEEYSVERILRKRNRNGRVEYLIKWEGFNADHNTWEPRENLYCDQMVNNFERELKKKEKAQPKRTLRNTNVASGSRSDAGSSNAETETETTDENSESEEIEEEDEVPVATASREVEVERILGVTGSRSNELQFLLKLRGVEDAILVQNDQANLMCPQLILKYYQERIHWNNTF